MKDPVICRWFRGLLKLTVGLILSLPVLLWAEPSPDPGSFLIHNGDRVVFYGDSITDGQWYPILVESYVLTRYPKWRNTFSNRGVSGDNSGSISRFVRDVIEQKPNLCTYNMGFNDGGYDNFSSDRLIKWLANIRESVELAKKADPGLRMVLVSPIPNEVTVSKSPRWVSREPYPYAMLSFGAEEKKLAAKLGIPFIDLGLLYGQSMGLGQVVAGESFALSRDGVHPQREGQTLIAYHLLTGLHADGLVARTDLDATSGKIIGTRNCTIRDLSVNDGIIRFVRECESLPWPIPPEGRPFAFLARLEENLNADLLTIKGLNAPAYTLFIDDQKIGEIPAGELEEGLNLSRFPDTPMMKQAEKVMNAVHDRQMAEIGFWRGTIFAGKADGAGNPTDKATAEDRVAIDSTKKKLAVLQETCYSLNTPKPYTVRLEPLTTPLPRYAGLADAAINQPPLQVRISPLTVDWNRRIQKDKEIKVTIRNPARVQRNGSLSWNCPSGWTVLPSQAPFCVEPGKETSVSFTVVAEGGDRLMPAPDLQATWEWETNWPYPMIIRRPLELMPELTIPKGNGIAEFTGNLDNWKDAFSFALEQPGSITPAVPGKRNAWRGPDDLSGTFYMKWDESALYFAALVRDNEHLQNTSPLMMWSQDCVMLAFQLSEKGRPQRKLEYVLAARPEGDTVHPTSKDASEGTGPAIRFRTTPGPDKTTLLYEVAIPWERLAPAKPDNGTEFRFTFSVSDADSQLGKGFTYLEWTPGIQYGKNPADFARITLGDKKP